MNQEIVWEFSPVKDEEKMKRLQKELSIPFVIAKLLVNRGVDDYEKAKKFFRPSLKDLHNPFLMEDMDLAVERVLTAVERNEKILVYGDYDVDGTTSVALMYSYLRELTPHIEHYQPDRYTEGYGISFQGVEYAKQYNFSLVIALDCGTKAVDKIAKANEYGIDFIIADHHTPGEKLPEAKAILNPKKTSCSYPFKDLCGCGIGFKLIQAIQEKRKLPFEDILTYLDLVAIAIGADIVPLIKENRVLAYHGLKQIEKTPRIGIKTMLESAKKTRDITVSDLVFKVAPRINAAGRIASAGKAVKLLLSESEEDAKEWTTLINSYNEERKEIDKTITQEALELLSSPEYKNKKSTVVSSDKWHKGVVGIVASRLIETHYKPTIVLVEQDGIATGSARSVKGFDVYKAINQCSHLLERFGGHKYAAGLSLKLENLEAFKVAFEESVKHAISEEQEQQTITIEAELTPEDFKLDSSTSIFPKFYRLLKQMAPFGPQNMRPVFMMRNLLDTGYSRVVGEDHLKFNLKSVTNGMFFNGIGFGLGHKISELSSNQLIDIAFQVDENNYMNLVELQLLVKDFKPAKE